MTVARTCRTRRRLVGSVLALLVAACGSPTPSIPVVESPTPEPSAVAPTNEPSPVAPSAAPSPALAAAFTTPVPPGADAAWTAIHWRKLASGDPLTLVRSILRWRGGFIAVGWGASSTPVWTSTDGARWEPLPFNTATTFWPGLLVVGAAEVRGGLVALMMSAGPNDCGGGLACQTFNPPLMAWTSPDGWTWTPHGSPDLGPDLGLPAPWWGIPFLAAGPAGLVAAPFGPVAHASTSVDGILWRAVPAAALPIGLVIRGLVGTATGFTAVGYLPVDPDHFRAVALQSVDGVRWTGPFPLHLVSASGVIRAGTASSWAANGLVAARDGLIAVGTVMATPGASLWWQSPNGRAWRPLLNWPPLGPTRCQGEGCGLQPNGTLVGDGHRMVALRGGSDAGLWMSSDGLTWRRLPITGDLPGERATQAVLLPGGVLLSDRTNIWFGEAITK